jgi:uncharacterized protein (TIGR02145 family)
MYGRLYDWATAMNLSNSCNSSSCSSQVQSKHRGICPEGWHIPSEAEWRTLEVLVGGEETAGKHLKTASGWNNNGNGTDTYGFAALPGGGHSSSKGFDGLGVAGFWWSATEDFLYDNAYSRWISNNIQTSPEYKTYLLSIRCLQDISSVTSSSSASSSYTGSYGTLNYEGKSYKTVEIGEQTWMAENLNYDADGSKCYDNDPTNCEIYGRFYDWETAIVACPSGWHLPNYKEWTVLTNYVGDLETAGTKLKAVGVWYGVDNNTDEFGFAALPGGYGLDGNFNSVGAVGIWWSSDEISIDINKVFGSAMIMNSNSENVRQIGSSKTDLCNVRCVKD